MLCALLKCLHSSGLSLIRCSTDGEGERERGKEGSERGVEPSLSAGRGTAGMSIIISDYALALLLHCCYNL